MGFPFAVRSQEKIDLDEYLGFIEKRPKDERWQLVNGVAFMMAPATRWHQMIAGNLIFLLRTSLAEVRPELRPVHEVGLIVPGRDDFRPDADVVVIERGGPDKIWQRRFFLAAEVLSASNTPEFISEKRAHYIKHPDNIYVLIISQDRRQIDISARRNGWRRELLRGSKTLLELPEFGVSAPLADLYDGTGIPEA